MKPITFIAACLMTAIAAGAARLTHVDDVKGWRAYNEATSQHVYHRSGRLVRADDVEPKVQIERLSRAGDLARGTSAEPFVLFSLANAHFANDDFEAARLALLDLKSNFPSHGLTNVLGAGEENARSAVDAALADCEREIEIRATHEIKRLPEAVLNPDEKAVFHTNLGSFEIQFYKAAAPATVANFRKLCTSGYFNDTYVHKVVPLQRMEMGCPNTRKDNRPRTDDGFGSPGYDVPLELTSATHIPGSVSMLRVHGTDRAHGSQFAICITAQPELNNVQPVFGMVIEGMDVVRRITQQRADDQNNPYESITIRGVEWIGGK